MEGKWYDAPESLLESTESSFTFVEAEPTQSTQIGIPIAIPEPTVENVFLADLGGETDEIRVHY